MRVNLRSKVALLVAAGLALAACGSSAKPASNTSTGASSSVPGAAAAAPSGPAITVGTICSCTGAQVGVFGELNNVAQVWAKWTNTHGGLNGHPVHLVAKDDGGDPGTALNQLKELIGSDKAVAIIDDSLVDAAWASYAKQKAVPIIGGADFEPTFLANPNFYASGGSTVSPPIGVVKHAAAAGLNKLGILYCAESPVCQLSGVLMKAVISGTSSPVTTKLLPLAATAPSYNSECLAFKDAGVRAIFESLAPTTLQRFVDQCATLGYKPQVLLSSAGFAHSWLKDPLFDGAYVASTNANYLDPSVPGSKSFLAAIDQYAPSLKSSTAFNYATIYPWLGGQLLVAAAKAGAISASATPADIKRGLYALHGETLNGLASPLTFTPNQPTGMTCWFDMQIKSGQLVTLGDGQPKCLPVAQHTALLGPLQKRLGG